MEIKAGQVIEIVKNCYIVVATKLVKSCNELSNNSYYSFKTIPKDDFISGKENIKEKEWTIKDLSSMHGPNEVRLKNIKLIDEISLKKETITKYLVM